MRKRLSIQIPKQRPKNYQIQISARLSQQGFQVTPEKVRNVLRGKNKDLDLSLKIHHELKAVIREHKSKIRQIEKVKEKLKKS